MNECEQLLADLKFLVHLIPEELQDDNSYEAAQRLYEYIENGAYDA